jgi:hypothetical protein
MRVCDEPDETASTVSGHSPRRGNDIGLEVGKGAELTGNRAGERVRALEFGRLSVSA